MTTQIALQQHAIGRMIGMRSSAVPIRKTIELALQNEREVIVNFSGVEVTQSFVDELLGALILREGPEIMQRLILKGCSEQTRGIVKFVAADRAEQFMLATH
ncbi:STAS-like domain-containing protein [Rhodoferax sp.]|uniref:STAS-like domain-containing protein n=1 Tax=Rhodoferax sp. TaxID=50421 RepID=UPI002778B80C|nr:STAS-like domain-containing protein [Rhodoferax sp.]